MSTEIFAIEDCAKCGGQVTGELKAAKPFESDSPGGLVRYRLCVGCYNRLVTLDPAASAIFKKEMWDRLSLVYETPQGSA